MKLLTFLCLMLLALQSNGQSTNGYFIRLSTNGDSNDLMCIKRGHIWKDVNPLLSPYNLGNSKPDTVRFPVNGDTYIRDEKEVSYRITPVTWNYVCERCRRDSVSYKKEIVWRKP